MRCSHLAVFSYSPLRKSPIPALAFLLCGLLGWHELNGADLSRFCGIFAIKSENANNSCHNDTFSLIEQREQRKPNRQRAARDGYALKEGFEPGEI